MKALARNVEERYQSLDEMQDDLARWCGTPRRGLRKSRRPPPVPEAAAASARRTTTRSSLAQTILGERGDAASAARPDPAWTPDAQAAGHRAATWTRPGSAHEQALALVADDESREGPGPRRRERVAEEASGTGDRGDPRRDGAGAGGRPAAEGAGPLQAAAGAGPRRQGAGRHGRAEIEPRHPREGGRAALGPWRSRTPPTATWSWRRRSPRRSSASRPRARTTGS